MSAPRRHEPIAMVGIGCLYPEAQDKDALDALMRRAEPRFSALPLERYWRVDDDVRERLAPWRGAFFDSLDFDFKRFRIPPVYRRSISQMMLMLLQVADDCVRDAGVDADRLPRDDVDVICGTCFGFDSTITNALKVDGVRLAHDRAVVVQGHAGGYAETLRERLRAHFGVSSHDRVGEMASSIPARIAAMLSLRGRVQAVESADATGYAVLENACLSLWSGQSRAVIAASGQRIDNLLMPLALGEKGLASTMRLGEGATALLLKRLSDARADGDRVYGVIRGLAARKSDSPAAFGYGGDTSHAIAAARESCVQAGIETADQQVLDCIAPELPMQTALADALGAGSAHRGASVELLGHSFANATLASVAMTCVAMERQHLPSTPAGLADQAGESSVANAQHWQPGADGNRIAGLCGSSIAGVSWHVVLADGEGEASSPVATPVEPIAIVGLGGAFGPCGTSAEFAEQLQQGLDAVQPVPEDVLPRAAYFSHGEPRALASYADKGADLKQREFDLRRFRVFPHRAAAMDRAQKLVLQVADEALRDFGLDDKRASLGRAAVFVGSNLSLGRERAHACDIHGPELEALLGSDEDGFDTNAMTVDRFSFDGSLASGSAAIVSNCFGLEAMPVAVEAACASSLAALNDAVLALREGRYDLVLAGGVELPVNARDLVLCSSQMMLSKDRIAPFAVEADGFSPGDGAGLFVLKRLSDAERDADRVHAVITGIGGSADAVSMTAPDADGQALAIRRAFDQAGYSPATVQYVETHGTGTHLGDITELNAIGELYGAEGREQPLGIGSVKSNIGHTFAAAGSAGLLKTVLAMTHEIIPPTLLRRELNTELPLAAIPGEVITQCRPWPKSDGPRRAAVSSFGTGGINYHLLLASA